MTIYLIYDTLEICNISMDNMKARNYKITNFVMASGERYCLLVDRKTGLPPYYPNLYVTTQIRNRSLSTSAMESALSAINVLLTFFDERGLNIESRFLKREFLLPHELDSIRDFCQLSFISAKLGKPEESSNIQEMAKKSSFDDVERTGLKNQYIRLSHAGKYLSWFARHIFSGLIDKNTNHSIDAMEKGLLARRRAARNRNQLRRKLSLSEVQQKVLLEVVGLESVSNPFADPGVRSRNQLLIHLLFYLGIRSGELLNIRMRDIDWERHQIVIARRADEADDPRVDQPLVKTLDRRLPLRATLVEELRNYILMHRKKVPNARRHDFLFVTHKSGSYQGQPLSRSSYLSLIKRIAASNPQLIELHGHLLRHTWNDNFSNFIDEQARLPGGVKLNSADEEKIRSQEMGWQEGSGTSASYNRRHIERKGQEASLKMQEGKFRLPRSMKNE